MKKSKGILIMVLVIIALLGLYIGMKFIFSKGEKNSNEASIVSEDQLINEKSNSDKYHNIDIDEQSDIALDDVEEIFLNCTTANINIIDTDKENIEVCLVGHTHVKSYDYAPRLDIDKSNGKIEINEVIDNNSTGLINIGQELNIELKIPKGYTNKLYINNFLGDINISSSNELIKYLSVECEEGNISIKNMLPKEVVVINKEGNVELQNIGGEVSVDSYLGDVKVKNLKANGNIYLKVNKGDVETELLKNTYKVIAKSSKGKVKVENYKADSDIVLDIQVNEGDINVK
ncbi:Hypothetical protein CM240_2323 [Clostridium bornimense]|uniref:DUF4097 domain-containing protein n=1 Tax=Clostridium bornimense TaxID=1216932 RepID=W6SII2_9CLOT|nr:DUF4097 family beta strand repeat-containing protein [Clostridium bornimense]CDM69460.1 Hypothetical protein CM240_2323 [Clostridium bornimense]